MKIGNKTIKPGGLIIAIAVLFFIVWKGVPAFLNTDLGQKIAPSKKVQESMTINKVTLPDAPKNIENTAPAVPLPGTSLATLSSPEIRSEIWAWNAQMGLIFSVGGSQTTKGSIMEKRNVNLHLIRQDDVPQMQAHLIQFAKAYQTDKNTKEGVQFVSIMGDGAATFLAGVNSELDKLGENYTAQIIGSPGKSLGEDKLMAPESWRDDPQQAKGKTIAGVLRDGDWNIAIMWASANGIPVNPDETTYDPDAINFINADNYIDAGTKYINDFKEERPIAHKGKIDVLSGKHTVTVDGVVTWTPGDVNVAEKKGGIVNIVSTKEYQSQMADVIIGIKQYMQDNRSIVQNMLAGIFEGGDQVKGYTEALKKAGELSAKVYNEQTGDYWVKYYKGQQVADKQGKVVSLGGSRVHNLADNMEYFGISQGSTDIYQTVYKTFGDIVVSMYPKLVPNYPDYSKIVDLSYLKNVASNYAPSQITAADEVKYNTDAGITTQVSKRSWKIQFQTGKATFTPEALSMLEQIKGQALIGSGLQLRIEGHTDNVGSDNDNIHLSQARANAVRDWLMQQAPTQFHDRVTTKGYGSTHPVPGAERNATESQRQQNRRVDILFGI